MGCKLFKKIKTICLGSYKSERRKYVRKNLSYLSYLNLTCFINYVNKFRNENEFNYLNESNSSFKKVKP